MGDKKLVKCMGNKKKWRINILANDRVLEVYIKHKKVLKKMTNFVEKNPSFIKKSNYKIVLKLFFVLIKNKFK